MYNKGTLIGKRTKEKHITLQNVYNFLLLLIKNTKIAELPKEKILNITLTYFNCIKELLPVEWSDYKQYRLTHIVCLNAFAIAGNIIIPSNYNFVSNQLNIKEVNKRMSSIKIFDWSSEGTLKYLKGASGSKLLAEDIIASVKKEFLNFTFSNFKMAEIKLIFGHSYSLFLGGNFPAQFMYVLC
ncbi:hypothetical protein [Peribacillus frigoritolerans]|uniref:hypothetical protein n=1 Tax=Peribacillus frigoritolerans TaxID=450367 RepID=UPI0021AA49EF|nr:hypothetical protein [Peribacillus frigoritolerans]